MLGSIERTPKYGALSRGQQQGNPGDGNNRLRHQIASKFEAFKSSPLRVT